MTLADEREALAEQVVTLLDELTTERERVEQLKTEHLRFRASLLTMGERALLEDLGRVMTMFRRLPEHHPADLDEATLHIHALQNLLMGRAAARAYPSECAPLQPGHGVRE